MAPYYRHQCITMAFLLLYTSVILEPTAAFGSSMAQQLAPMMLMLKKSGMGRGGVMELLAAGMVVKMLQGIKIPKFMTEDSNGKIVAVPVVLNQGGMMGMGWNPGGMMGGGWNMMGNGIMGMGGGIMGMGGGMAGAGGWSNAGMNGLGGGWNNAGNDWNNGGMMNNRWNGKMMNNGGMGNGMD